MDNGIICICCRRRYKRENTVINDSCIGICRDCDKKIEYVKPDTVFRGINDLDSLFSSLLYTEPIKTAIRRYKFESQVRYANIFVDIMHKYLKDFHLEREFDFMTSIPLSRKRLYERGYSQTELLAKPLAERLGIPYVGNCLYKRKHNKKQSGIRIKYLRFENVRDVYIADSKKVEGKNILLLDDVYTSGATMNSCVKELKKRGAESVVGVTLAVGIK